MKPMLAKAGKEEIMARTHVECSLCGSTVPPEETQKLGYCKVCLLLIEAFAGK